MLLAVSLTLSRGNVGSTGHNDLIRISLRIKVTKKKKSITALVCINEIENVISVLFYDAFPIAHLLMLNYLYECLSSVFAPLKKIVSLVAQTVKNLPAMQET